jgi:D-3-phosphoglycerate dehydrogenase
LDLAERLGSFQAQLEPSGIQEVVIDYSGQVAEFSVAPITAALLKGLLASLAEEGVNYVNAPLMAKERGIRVAENKTSMAEDFSSLIRFKVRTSHGEGLVAGTIFGKKEPRIVRVNQFPIEAIPEGYMLLLDTNDRPGVIGNIGMTLGQHGINIGRMQFGRELKEGRSLVVLNLDQRAGGEVIEKLKALPNIVSVHQLEI